MTEPAEIAAEARQIARGWSGPGAPEGWWLTAAIFDGIATDRPLLEALAALPPERLPALLASAAILDLARRDPGAGPARYLPEPGHRRAGPPPQPLDDGRFASTLAAFCADHLDAIVEVCAHRRYQMSEVRRSAQVALGIAATCDAARPIALVDVGAGAGFGLQLDRYRYVIGDLTTEPTAITSSAVTAEPTEPGDDPVLTLTCTVKGSPPPPLRLPPIEARVGIEVDPLDLDHEDDRAWLLACTPPEATAIDRVTAAIEVARQHPSPLVAGDAVDALPEVLAHLPTGLPVVVVDSYVAVFLDDDRRRALRAAMESAGRDRDLTWLALDPLVPLGPDGRDSVQGITVPDTVLSRRADGVFALLGAWRAGTDEGSALARAHPSGEWIEWIDAAV